MPEYVKNPHFRKFSPIDREYPIYELVDDDRILFDVSANDDGIFEVAFHEGGVNQLFTYDKLIELLAEGKRLVKKDIEDK